MGKKQKLTGQVNWHDVQGFELQLEELQAKDQAFSRNSIEVQLRSRNEALERENALLRSMQDTWVSAELNRPPLTIRRLIRLLFKKT